MDTQTLIIGGGLSGLALAGALQDAGRDYIIVEGRDRFGGRIFTGKVAEAAFDLGPAWFWPGQPRIAALIAKLGLDRFDQFAEGILAFEDENGQVQRGRGFASMEGSWRLKGGLGALIDALAAAIPDARKRLDTKVTRLTKSGDGITATFADGRSLRAQSVVLALPPRVAAQLAFSPALPADALQSMQDVPTWMAGQAKAVAVYEKPFWRDAGLSGDAMSRRGPMVEIHDASPAVGGLYALFGFIGVPPAQRMDADALRAAVLSQLVRLFGKDAADPRKLFIKDWARDPFTATALDQAPLYAHPEYGLPRALADLWAGDLIFAGTEVAPQFGGYIEGALEAAENAARMLAQKVQPA